MVTPLASGIYAESDLGYLGDVKLKWIGNTISGPQDIQAATTGDTDFGGAFNGAIVKLKVSKAPITAVVSYYGSALPNLLGLAPDVTSPSLHHFGTADAYIPPETVERIRAASFSVIGCGLPPGPRKPVTFGVFFTRW